jgi:hypothetical protein
MRILAYRSIHTTLSTYIVITVETIDKFSRCLPCLMKDQVWSENSLSIYDLFSYYRRNSHAKRPLLHYVRHNMHLNASSTATRACYSQWEWYWYQTEAFELTYFNDLLTYLKTIRAKVVIFGIRPKLMKCRFELTYFYDLLTYLKTIGAKVVMFGIKPKLMKCRFELTYTKKLFRLSLWSNTPWKYTAVLNMEYTCNVTFLPSSVTWHRWAHGPIMILKAC